MNPSWHTMRPGDTLRGLAAQRGLDSESDIFDAPENATLRSTRPDASSVRPGDDVFLPAPAPLHSPDADDQVSGPEETSDEPSNPEEAAGTPLAEERKAIVVYAARNLMNTVDIRPGGHAWFSA